MKFFKEVEKLQNSEEGKNKIIIVKCGAFFVSIGKDAVILSTLLGLKVNCLKLGICKVGIPINYIMKCFDCKKCDYYKTNARYKDLDIFEISNKKQEMEKDKK